jgi:hypothetical protein
MKAAADLSVTQGAVSHQVKALEADLGLRLLLRESKRLILTDTGRGLFGSRTKCLSGSSMNGVADRLDYIADARGLFSLPFCDEAIVPRRLYAAYR